MSLSEKLAAVAQDATPAPWYWDWVDDLTEVPTKRWTTDSYTVEPAICATSRFKGGYDDAKFIATSRKLWDDFVLLVRLAEGHGMTHPSMPKHACPVCECLNELAIKVEAILPKG